MILIFWTFFGAAFGAAIATLFLPFAPVSVPLAVTIFVLASNWMHAPSETWENFFRLPTLIATMVGALSGVYLGYKGKKRMTR